MICTNIFCGATAPFVNIVNACPELYDRTVVLNGVSKAYSMTGWRIGYCGGPADLIAAMKKTQSQSTSNPCSISQVAAEAALNGDQGCIAPMLKAFKERHDFVVERLNAMNGVTCLPSDGTFYAFADFRDAIANRDGINTDLELADYLLNDGQSCSGSWFSLRCRRLHSTVICNKHGKPGPGAVSN